MARLLIANARMTLSDALPAHPPTKAPSHIAFRLATLVFAACLGVQGIWLLLTELSRLNVIRLPTDAHAATAAAKQRVDTTWTAWIGGIRGDLWAESAYTYASLLWTVPGSEPDSNLLAQARVRLDRAVGDAPHQSGAWLLLAGLASRYGWSGHRCRGSSENVLLHRTRRRDLDAAAVAGGGLFRRHSATPTVQPARSSGFAPASGLASRYPPSRPHTTTPRRAARASSKGPSARIDPSAPRIAGRRQARSLDGRSSRQRPRPDPYHVQDDCRGYLFHGRSGASCALVEQHCEALNVEGCPDRSLAPGRRHRGLVTGSPDLASGNRSAPRSRALRHIRRDRHCVRPWLCPAIWSDDDRAGDLRGRDRGRSILCAGPHARLGDFIVDALAGCIGLLSATFFVLTLKLETPFDPALPRRHADD